MLRNLLTLIFFSGAALAEELPAFTPEALEFFEKEVRPVLVETCFECHTDKAKGGLRLDARAALLSGGSSGAAVLPGNPDGSLLLQVLNFDGPVKMPPTGKLPEEKLAAIRQWVADGAAWPVGWQPGSVAPAEKPFAERAQEARARHWAFQPITLPAIPSTTTPNWATSPIDSFVLEQLEAKALKPSPRAAPGTLLRRVYYDLIGLPPSAEAIAAFEADNSPAAYAKVVDDLLAAPQYGERWARYWLDIARYADTKGYVFQEERAFPFSHTYRDFVIRSLNEDLPYDQFLRYQLAADQMDLGEDKRPLAAMGFLTLGRRFVGNIHDITDDRIDVVTRGMMGLTVSCARCHDHKYDPISAADYYALYGVFRSSVEPAELPLIEAPDPSDAQYQAFEKEVGEAEKNKLAYENSLHVNLLAHVREKFADYLLAAHDARDLTENEAIDTIARDRLLRSGLLKRFRDFLKEKSAAHDPIYAPWTAFALIPADQLPPQAAALALKIEQNNDPAAPLNRRIAQAFKGEAPKSMPEVAERYRRVFGEADKAWINELAGAVQIALMSATAPVFSTALPDGELEAVRLAMYGADSPANVPAGDVQSLSDVPSQERTRQLNNVILRLKATHPGRPDRAMALVDNAQLFEPYVFLRGKPDSKGPAVPRQFLTVLANDAPVPFQKGSGRLELAEAIIRRDNPLTARVMANRVWMYHFGKGLVDTPSDFGLRSTGPSHPKLLDFLAHQFMEQGWSIKKLHRLIMLSSTYQQGSASNAAGLAADAENRLLWRQNRRRLDFEAMRDSVLLAAGKLDLTLGGPSVDITTQPFPNRRTVYSHIERQNLPQLFRTFDFATPDTHSPARFKTTVPQQALFLMNSPFVASQAQALTARPEVAALETPADRIRSLYRIVHQREPGADELQLAEHYVATQTTDPPAAPPWEYGYGRLDTATGKLSAYQHLPHFTDGMWRGGPNLPDTALGWVLLEPKGGHPGRGDEHSTVLRWLPPGPVTFSISGELKHGSTVGDGVQGYIVSSKHGILWQGAAHNSESNASVADVSLEKGDTLEFIVACGADENTDGYGWSPRIRLTGVSAAAAEAAGARAEWRSNVDFAGPPPPPLSPWEKYAQVLLLTNEFMFVD